MVEKIPNEPETEQDEKKQNEKKLRLFYWLVHYNAQYFNYSKASRRA